MWCPFDVTARPLRLGLGGIGTLDRGVAEHERWWLVTQLAPLEPDASVELEFLR